MSEPADVIDALLAEAGKRLAPGEFSPLDMLDITDRDALPSDEIGVGDVAVVLADLPGAKSVRVLCQHANGSMVELPVDRKALARRA